jgi:hypothetical protein
VHLTTLLRLTFIELKLLKTFRHINFATVWRGWKCIRHIRNKAVPFRPMIQNRSSSVARYFKRRHWEGTNRPAAPDPCTPCFLLTGSSVLIQTTFPMIQCDVYCYSGWLSSRSVTMAHNNMHRKQKPNEILALSCQMMCLPDSQCNCHICSPSC